MGIGAFLVICIVPDIDGLYTDRGQLKDVSVIRSDKLGAWIVALLPQYSEEEIDQLYESLDVGQ